MSTGYSSPLEFVGESQLGEQYRGVGNKQLVRTRTHEQVLEEQARETMLRQQRAAGFLARCAFSSDEAALEAAVADCNQPKKTKLPAYIGRTEDYRIEIFGRDFRPVGNGYEAYDYAPAVVRV